MTTGGIKQTSRAWTLLTAALVIALIGSVFTWLRSGIQRPPSLLTYIPAPANQKFTLLDDDASGPVVISPDGRVIAFVAYDPQGGRKVWVRALNEPAAKPLPNTDGATYPFWSPDAKWLAYFAEGKLKKVALNGGAVLTLADAARGRGGSWGDNGTILFAPSPTTGLSSVSDSGGAVKVVTTPLANVQTTNRWPYWLPGSAKFLYLAASHTNPGDRDGIYVAKADGTDSRFLVRADSNAVFTGKRLFYLQNGSLMIAPFDPGKARFTGDPHALLQDVGYNRGTWRGAFDVASNGILVTQTGGPTNTGQLSWYTPGSDSPTHLGSPGQFAELRLSPDGKRLAVNIGDPRAIIFIYELASGVKTRFTLDELHTQAMTWSPDGRRLAYTRITAQDKYEIVIKETSGMGNAELLISEPGYAIVQDWSPDGNYLVYDSLKPTANTDSLWVVSLQADRKARELVSGSGPYSLCCARVSPDGKWLAYTGRDESGEVEVFVTSFPSGNQRWQLTNEGAGAPHWRHNGRALLYTRFVTTCPRLESGTPMQKQGFRVPCAGVADGTSLLMGV